MRTTVELPDPLFREVKAAAARRGTSLKVFIRSALEKELQAAAPAGARRIEFPLLKSSQPGSLRLSNADIDDLLA